MMIAIDRTERDWRIDYDGQISTVPTEEDKHSHSVCRLGWDSFKEFNEGDNKKVALLIKFAPKMLEALKEIRKGNGAYSEDQLEHAGNTIADMKAMAEVAVALIEDRRVGDERRIDPNNAQGKVFQMDMRRGEDRRGK